MIDLKIDATAFLDVGRAYERAGKDAPKFIARAMNHTGAKANTQVKRVIAKETGVKAGDAAKALSVKKAWPNHLTFEIVGRGGALPTRYFGARQTKRGVSAAPWNDRRVFPRTFIVPGLGNNVFHRQGGKLKTHWGPSIPRELIRGESFDQLEREFGKAFVLRLLHELARALR